MRSPEVINNPDFIRLYSRYKLAKWASGDLDTETGHRSEDFVEHNNSLADQWLGLMIALISERSVPGLGEAMTERSSLRTELIQLLCVEPLSHSHIVKRIPVRKNENELDEVLKEIATLKSCTKSAGKKLYHLREGLESEYNMFYYGYSKEQQTAAQEAQLQARKKAGEDKEGFPPPRLLRLTKMMAGLFRVLESDVLLQAAMVTLRRAAEEASSRSKYVTEQQVHKVVYLLALGIREQEVESRSRFVSRAKEAGIVEQLTRLAHDTNNALMPEHVRRLASWVVRQCTKDQKAEAMDVDNEASEQEMMRKRKAEAAKARHAKIMAQMKANQAKFATENKEALDEMKEEKHDVKKSEAGHCSSESETVCLGPGLSSRVDSAHHYTCILCQEDGSDAGPGTMVLAAYIQKSTVLGQLETRGSQSVMFPHQLPMMREHHLHVSRGCGPHVSTCGHAMHSSCYQKFFSILERKEQERNNSFGIRGLNIDVSEGEFLCPICERLSNTVLPLLPSVTQVKKKQSSMPASEISFNSFVNGLRSTVDSWYLKEDKEDGPAMHRIALKTTFEEQSSLQGPEFAQYFRGNVSRGQEAPLFDENTVSMMNVFSMATFTTSLKLNPYEDDYRVPLVCLQAAAYTLVSIERMLDTENKPLFGSLNPREEDCVRNVTRYVAMFPSSYTTEQGGVTRVQVRNSKNSIRLQFLQSNAMFLVSTILCRVTPDDTNPLMLDAFGVLVSLTASLPCLFNSDTPPRLPSGQGMELHCLKLCLLLHIVQIIYSLEAEDFKQMQEIRARTEENKMMDTTLSSVMKLKKVKIEIAKISPKKFNAKIEEKVVPFLRCAALLFQHYTDVRPGSNLAKDGGRSYGPLAKYLGLPASVKQLLDNPASNSVIINILDKKLSDSADSAVKDITLPKFPMSYRKSLPPKSYSTKKCFPLSKLSQNVGEGYKKGCFNIDTFNSA